MGIINDREKLDFMLEINELHHALYQEQPSTTLASLEHFEKQQCLMELIECLIEEDSEIVINKLKNALALRWERIRHSHLSYTEQAHDEVNQLCLNIAKKIADANTGHYSILMPSLEITDDLYGDNIHDLQLNEFILSDDQSTFIPVAQCLKQVSISDEGVFRHMTGDGDVLSDKEISRLSAHSREAFEYYESVIKLRDAKILGDDIGSQLRNLSIALRGGGAHAAGQEMNAGEAANIGIIKFYAYWESVSEVQKTAFFNTTPELRELIGRLFRPESSDYTSVSYCVELIAQGLDPIIDRYERTPAIGALQAKVEEKERAFNQAMEQGMARSMTQNSNPPKGLWSLILKLDNASQTQLFKHETIPTALNYILQKNIDALCELEPDDVLKQEIINWISPGGETALIRAAKEEKIAVMQRLLSWGANIESKNHHGETALHYAAARGKRDALKCLLEHKANINALGQPNTTALNYAAKAGHKAVVELLLEDKNIIITPRDHDGRNALDSAIYYFNTILIKCITLHIALLPISEQSACLIGTNSGNIFALAVRYLFLDSLIDKMLEEPSSLLVAEAANYDNPSLSPLFCAAQHGSEKSLHKLLILDIDTTFFCNYAVKNNQQIFYKLLALKPDLDNQRNSTLNKSIDKMSFNNHLKEIYDHYKKMKDKADINPKYSEAAYAAEKLLSNCLQAKMKLFKNDVSNEVKIQEFQASCVRAVEEAQPVLSQHRSWGKLLAKFLLALVTLPVSLPLYAAGFFSFKTQSNQFIDKLKQDIEKPIGPENN